MSTVAQTQTLLSATVLLTTMSAMVWVGMAAVARVSPRASWTLAAANASAALALMLHGLRGLWSDLLTMWPADVLSISAFALLRAAVPAIITRRFGWRSALAVVGAGALGLALLPEEGPRQAQARIVNAAGALLSLLAAVDAYRHLRGAQMPLRTVLLLVAPLALIALLLALRGLHALMHPDRLANLMQPTGFNHGFLWGALLLALLQNATLAFLVLMRLVLRIRHLTEHDPLTAVLNRHAFNQALEAAHAGSRRGRGYALVMIDMDRFKHLNDSLGHAAGDAALLQLVRELQPCLREVDRFGRLGGEEFCVLLPGTDLVGAALVAERMRGLIDAAPLHWQGRDWPLSASFGIAEAEAGDACGEAVLGRADAALYRAKGQGRNVVQA
ncbi:diguanylate cyclase domain-containing protein [Roseateles sp.]|uniref:GGDEF domain-containing protein n=1 Tax=Roseateles sp. TaxID=1971397 RepID=UPI003BAA5C7E